jgi:arginyl-tRNA synthetase
MQFESQITDQVLELFPQLFGKTIDASQITFQLTRKEFEGDITLVTFPLSRFSGKSPEITGSMLGEALVSQGKLIHSFNVIKGFLNLSIHNQLWLNNLSDLLKQSHDDFPNPDSGPSQAPYLIEYSSPNTNKPLHLGHIRNILLGFSLSEIMKFSGRKVVKVNIVNDRGIHICKSMLAWKKLGNGETPHSSGMKGDHLVGKYYVAFDQMLKQQIDELKSRGVSAEEAERQAPCMVEAREMLQQWEAHNPEVVMLWKMMNGWVYEGFDATYRALGVDFDQIYYESDTYLLGKKIVDEGLSKGLLYRKEDGSVWIDLTSEGLDEKLLLRSDGTSVYMTQDLGTAVMRYEEYGFEKLVYVVGNEQDYHFKVLFLILGKLGYEWADRLYHLSYNMVDLPSGKMKSREGTVVDADELMDEMVAEARKLTMELGKLDDFASKEAEHLFHMLGMGALKYFILKVDPEKRMLFNPNESIDFNGNTGPFIQYTHARIRSVLRKAGSMEMFGNLNEFNITSFDQVIPKEKEVVRMLCRFFDVTREAADKYSPAVVANYIYELARIYNQFYHEHSIIDPDHLETSRFRLRLSHACAAVISKGMGLLGIEVPERM